MALEVRVFSEIRSFDPKVMWGMSWRQLALAGIGIPLCAVTYLSCWWFGFEDLGQWLVVLETIPLALFGWVHPKGLRFETWARYALASKTRDQKFIYADAPLFRGEREALNVRSKEAGARNERVWW